MDLALELRKQIALEWYFGLVWIVYQLLQQSYQPLIEYLLLKLEIISLKKPDYPYLRAAFRNRTEALLAIVIQRNGKLKAMKICLLTKSHKTENQKFLRRAQILIIRRQSAQLKGQNLLKY